MNCDALVKRQIIPVMNGRMMPAQSDALSVEEPLEIRVAGEPVAVTMRTPGADRELALGFLFAEGIVSRLGDIGRIAHCGRPGSEGYGNAIDALPAPGIALDPDRLHAARRGTLISSACGICGRERIDDLKARCAPLPDGPSVSVALIYHAMEALQSHQAIFVETGGVHGVAICGQDGEILACFEDVGRHNAVDKAVGALVFNGWPDRAAVPPAMLAVSGRASFEIVQKAAVARIPIVAAVSAPTSLAVDLARETNITLLGFVRKDRFSIYSGENRIV